jgi:signal transduction histidine kinase
VTIGTIALIKTPKGEKNDFAIVITCAIALLLGYEIFEQIYGGQTSNIYLGHWIVLWVSAYFAFLAIAVKRMIMDYKYLSRNTFFAGIALAGLTVAVVLPLFTTFFRSVSGTVTTFEYTMFVIIGLVDFIAFVTLVILLILYVQQKYGYYWIFLVVGFTILLFRDISAMYAILMNEALPFIGANVINFIFYSTMIVGLITLFDPDFELKTMQNIEMEREYYKTRYKELDTLSKDLITVTEFWFHDLHNDLNVIKNAFELYEESSDKKFQRMLTDRLTLIEERLKRFESPASILDSLKIKPTPIKSILDIQKAYENVKIQSPEKDIYVKANELLFPTVLNIIHNSFQHCGPNTEVSVLIEEIAENEKVVISIKDDGIGIPDEMKDKVFYKNFKFGDEDSSGMGLYLAKITIDKYGGKITLEDNIPKGVLFKIELDKIEP